MQKKVMIMRTYYEKSQIIIKKMNWNNLICLSYPQQSKSF